MQLTVIDDLSVVLPVDLVRFRNGDGGAVDVNVLPDHASLNKKMTRFVKNKSFFARQNGIAYFVKAKFLTDWTKV